MTGEGDAVVVYAATLRWGWLRLGYSATLARSGRDGSMHTTTRLGRPGSPTRSDEGLTFEDPRLGVRGEWIGPRGPGEITLHENAHGRVRWHCHLPRADVTLHHRGRRLHGQGYVEHLALEIAPWHLPIRVLRWGRLHAGSRSLVWIQWEGPHPLRLVLADGAEAAAGPIDDAGFTLADGTRVELGTPAVLRTGELGRTVLANRLLRWLPLPRSVRSLEETKMLAAASLQDAAGTIVGTALHEVVRWR